MEKLFSVPTRRSKRRASTSGRVILCFLVAGLVLTMLGPTGLAQPALPTSSPVPLLDERRPLAYLALDMERQAGFAVTDADYARLDRIIAQARRLLPQQTAYTKREAFEVLNIIAAVLAPHCPTLAPDVSDGLYSAALRSRVCDCDVLSVLYLTIADTLQLPLYGMLAPNHMLLLWEGPGVRMIWEPTEATEHTQDYYTQIMNISDTARQQGSYLRPLSRREIIGTLYHNRARVLLARGKAAAALVDLNRALHEHPKLVAAFYHRGAVYQTLGCYDEAIAAYAHAISLDPHHADALYGRGSSSFYLGQYEHAVMDFNRVAALEPEAADAYYARGMAHQKLGRLREAITDHTRATVLDSTLVEAFYNRGLAHLRLNEHPQAMNDLLTFLRRIAGKTVYAAYVPYAQRLVLALKQGTEGSGRALDIPSSGRSLERIPKYDP